MTENFSLRQILAKNMSMQLVGHVVGMGLGLAGTAILSRYLGVAAFGQFNYIFAFYYFFMTLNELGIDVVVVREVSKYPDQAGTIIGSLRTLKLCIALALLAVAWIIISCLDYHQPLRASLYAYGLVLPLIALELPSLVFQARLKLEFSVLIGILNRLANFTVIVALVAWGYKLHAFALGLVACELFSLMLMTFYSRRFVKPKWVLDFSICKKVFRSSLPIAITGIFVAIINRIDFIMLERMTDIREVGLYAAVYKVCNLLETFPGMIMATLYPVMSRYAQENHSKLKSVYQKSNVLLAAVGIPSGVAITLLAPWIVRIIFGSPYIEAIPGLQVLVWASVFVYLALSAGNLLISLGRERVNLWINAFAAGLNVLLNFLLIPKHGFVGAALATTIAYGFITVALRLSAAHFLRKPAGE